MRRSALLLAVIGSLALPGAAPAAVTGGAEGGIDPGGAAFDPVPPPAPLRIRSFAPSAAAVSLRVDGPVRRVRLRVDLLDATSRALVRRFRLGTRRTGRRMRLAWAPRLAPGDYLARLDAQAPGARRARRIGRTPLRVAAPAPPPPAPPPAPPAPGPAAAPRFPVQGLYTFGGEDARFGAGRPGHSHQGQDMMAAQGTPIVSPVAGVVHWRAYQAEGAGHYLVIRADDGRDLVFMHMRAGSLTVDKGAPVAAGQRIGEVGNTGYGPEPGHSDEFTWHLHVGIQEPSGEWVNPYPLLRSLYRAAVEESP